MPDWVVPSIFWVLAAAALAAWAVPAAQMLAARWRSRQLADMRADGLERWPRLSVIVAARDEAETVEPAMRTLLSLDYPDLEVIAVDDRSADATGAVLERLSAQDRRLRVIHVRDLPAGWLGKTHAMHTGGLEATGDWLLFTDADVHFEPLALRRAVSYATEHSVDHLAVAPELPIGGFWESVMLGFFGVLYMMHTRPWKLADPASTAHVGVGAFNLVRAAAYRWIGGHAALPMEVLDDVKLGKLLRRAGARQDFLAGVGCVRVRWVVGVGGLVRGLTKNLFAIVHFNLLYALAACAGILLMATWPAAGVFVGPAGPRILCWLALAAMAAAGRAGRFSARGSWLTGLGFPVAGLVFIYMIARSAAVTLWRGGVVWRGTFYPLRDLRKGLV